MTSVQTVLGPIPPDKLGITLSHEHILVDGRCWLTKPAKASRRYLIDAPVSIENLGVLHWDPFICRDNLVLDNIEDAISELRMYKNLGGNSIVEVTTPDLKRNPQALRRISKAVGVNIICGTGWYLASSHPPIVAQSRQEELTDIMVRELIKGIGDTEIRAGVIGEIGCSEPLHPDEEKVLRAAARAQRITRAPMTIHPANWDLKNRVVIKRTDRYLDIVEQEGADLSKIYISHVDGSYYDKEGSKDYHRSLLERGVTINFDCFGNVIQIESFFPGLLATSDRDRVEGVAELCDQGYDKQIMISQDIFTKIQWRRYGGQGYAHILEHIVPALRVAGVEEDQIENILINNPKRILSF